MTRTKVYKILRRVTELDTALRIIDMQIERMESCLQGHAIRYDADKVQTSPEDRVAEVVANMDDLLKRRARLRLEMSRAVTACADLIATVKDDRKQLVLHYRYTSGFRWHEIARALGCSERHVYRLHDSAIDQLTRN